MMVIHLSTIDMLDIHLSISLKFRFIYDYVSGQDLAVTEIKHLLTPSMSCFSGG